MNELKLLGAVGVAGLIASCAYGGTGSVVVVTEEAAGANCMFGGVRIDVGPDANQDGTPDRVVSTNYLCNGGSPAASLTRVVTEAPGANCVTGGVRIESGLDSNGSGSLESAEVIDNEYVCNGQGGSSSAASLTDLSTEPDGANCADGGVRVDNGPDTDGDGTLDPEEIADTRYVCNGADGVDGSAVGGTLTDVTVEASGVNCSTGGVRIQSGVDSNANGTLDGGEVTRTAYVCNGTNATFGSAPMVTAYNSDTVTANGTSTVTVISTSINAPQQGTVLVLANAVAYCSATATPRCASPGPQDGYFTISASPSGTVTSGPYAYFFLAPDVSETISRTQAYNVPAGTHTFYARGGGAVGGAFGFWRREMTLVYVPRD